jgi:hypothetical protein
MGKKRRKRTAAEQYNADRELDLELHEMVLEILKHGSCCLVVIPLSWARRLDELQRRRERQAEDN